MPLLGKSQNAREFKRLQKARLKAQSNNNTKEEAEICNQLGELLAKHGEYEEAIEEHRNELHLSESIGDILGTAIAHRKIGECLSSLDRFGDAVKHQQSHLRLARSLANHVEEQRALATLGRTYLLQADSLTGTEGATTALIKSQQAFLKSLDVCDLLRDVVPISDYNEMRARLFLNLGIVLDNKGEDTGEWRAFIKKCIFICEKHKLLEDLYRAHYTLGDIYQRRGYPAQALRSIEAALQCAKKMKDKFIESECLASTAQIHLHLGDWPAAKRALRKAYKLGSLLDKDRHRIVSCLRTAIKGCHLLRELRELSEEDHQGRMCVYEKLGDTSSDLGLYSKAVEYYNKQLSCATQLQKPARQMAVIHYSLAASYADMKEFGKAVDHYRQELQFRKGNVKEECKTLLLLAQALEDDGNGYSQLETVYQQALQAARQTDSDKLKIRVLKHFCMVQEQFGVDSADLREELSCVRDESGVASGESSDEEAESDRGASESVEEVDLSASDDSENEEYDRGTTGRARKGWMNRKNEKGESMLHRACIDGNLKLVKSLVEQGHPINPRDYSGWLPLHEACNHGYLDIVEYLVDHSAAINDRGGEHCEGITPLHDAAICGHGDIVQLLVSKGANVLAKDDEGRTPLEALVSWRQSYEKELDEEALNLTLRTERVLRTAMKEGNPKAAPVRSRSSLHDDLFDKEDSESANAELAVPQQVTRRQPPSRVETNTNRRKETGRTLQRSKPQERKQRVDKRSHAIGCVESDDSEGSNDVDSYSGDSLSQSQPVSDIDMETFQHFSENDVLTSSQVPNEGYEDDFVELRPARTKQRNRVMRPRVVNDRDLEEETFGSQVEPEVHLRHNLHKETDTVSLLDDPTNVYQQAMASVGSSAVRREFSQIRPRDHEEASSNHTSALINEEEYTGGDDWLVDDVVQRPAKRQKLSCAFSGGNQTRSVSSRKPSTGSGGEGDVSNDAGVNSRTQARGSTSNRTSGRNRLTRPKRQTQLTLTGMGMRQQDRRQGSNMVDLTEDSQVFPGLSSQEDTVVPNAQVHRTAAGQVHSAAAGQVHNTAAGQVPMRLRVKVQDKTFLIPIPNSDSNKSIDWLGEQASQRYYNMCGLRPRLALHTREGAMLEAHDAIADVLSTNEEVVGRVQSWDLPPLPERYIKACENSNSAVHARVRALCESQQTSARLSASSLGLRLPSLSPLLSALQCQYCIKTLVLAGNRIGDKGSHLLASAVVTLPNLVQLDISCTGLTQAGLTTMAEVLGGDQGTTGQLHTDMQSGKPLQHLEDLNLGFNPLGDSCTLPLARLVQACPLLTVLQLQSCCLSMKVFQQHRRQLTDGLKGALHLQTLDISHNPLGSTGVELLLKCLAQDVVTSLDLRGVIATSSNNHLARHVSLYLAQPDCVLKHLSVADNYLCDDMLEEITRALQSNPTLQSLQVSTNCKLGNQTLQSVLETVQSGVPLQELDMSGCGLTAPLSNTTLELLQHTTVALRKLRLCGNNLKKGDKDQIVDLWHMKWGGKALVYVEKNSCMLGVGE